MSNKSKESIAFEDTMYEKEPSAPSTPGKTPLDAPPNPPEKEGQSLPVMEPRYYQNQKEFARGGLGRILNAYDARLGRTVAIKELLHKQGNAEPRFLLEARITARLEHPSIVPIYEVGYWPSGDPYYSMQLLTGEPLNQHIQKRPHLIERLSLLPQVISVCQAIAYAHAKNIIHRDLKPHNVLLGEFGEAVVIDWGLAKEIHSQKIKQTPNKSPSLPAPIEANQETLPHTPSSNDLGLTVDGAIMGTPAYMPPEQARGDEVDARADIYALGAILYHLVTGQPPYAGMKTRSVVLLVQSQPPEELTALQPDVPGPLRSIIERAMERDPARRYQSALALADDLSRFQSGGLVTAHSYSPIERLSRVFDRHKNVVMISGLSLFLIFLVGLFSLVKIYQANQSEEAARIEAEQARDKATKERSIAETQRDQMKKSARALLIDQGRAELSNQSYQRALPLLSAAYQEAAPQSDQALRFLLSEALQQTESNIKTFTGHDNPVSSIGFSPDGALFFTSSSDQRVMVWEAASSSRLKSFGGYSASFLTNEELLIYVKEKDAKRVEIRNINTEEVLSSWPVEQDASLVVVSPDGKYAATLGETPSLRLVRSGELLIPATAFTKKIVELKLSASQVFLLDAAGTFYTWEISTGQVTQRSIGLSSVMMSCISPDGAVAAYSFEGVGLLWSATSQASTPLAYSDQISYLRFSPDGAMLAVGDGKSILLYKNGMNKRLEAHSATVTSLAFSSDSSRLLSTSIDGTAKLWAMSEGEPGAALLVQTFSGHSQPVLSAYFSPDAKTIFTASRDKTVIQWNITNPKISMRPSGHQSRISALQFSPDGSLLVFSGFAKRLSFIKADTQQLLQEKSDHANVIIGQGYSPRGKRLITIDSKGDALIWDTSTRERLASVSIKKRPLAVAFIGEEEFAVANEDGSVSFWDTKSGGLISTVEGQGKPLRVSVSPRQGLFALVSSQQLWIFSLKEKKFVHTIEAPGGNNLFSAIFSSGEDRVLVLTFGSTADVFDLGKKRWVASLSMGPQGFISAVYSPDDSMLATTSVDGTVALWDGQKNVPLASRRSSLFLDGSVLAFSPDSSLLVSTTASSAFIFWKISPEARSADTIKTLTQKLSPWRFEDGNLVLQ